MHYFIDKKDDKSQLILLNAEAIYAQALAPAELDHYLNELKAGKSPASLFDKKATHISLRNLQKVQCSSTDEALEFSVKLGAEEKSESIEFADLEVRASVYACVAELTHGRFLAHVDQMSRPRAAFKPLLSLSIIGIVSWMLVAAARAIRGAEHLDVAGRKSGLKKLFVAVLDGLGPTGVSVIGAALALLTLWHLSTQLRNPPKLWILQEGKYQTPGSFGMALRYAGLSLMLLVAARVIFH